MSNKFHFIGGIISDHDNPINVQNAFIDIGRGRESFNMSEVDDIATNVFKAPINFEALAKNNVRVSEDIFVNKNALLSILTWLIRLYLYSAKMSLLVLQR